MDRSRRRSPDRRLRDGRHVVSSSGRPASVHRGDAGRALLQHCNDPPPRLTSLNLGVSEAAERVVERALCKQPEDRYYDAGAMLRDIEALLHGQPSDLAIHPRLPECDSAPGPPVRVPMGAGIITPAALAAGDQTTIEECLNPPVIWERGRGWFTTEPFSEPEVFTFPAGIGPVECVNVEHEEVLLMPRWVQAQRVTFKYGLGEEFIAILRMLHQLGLDRTDPVQVGAASVSPRDVVAACLPTRPRWGTR